MGGDDSDSTTELGEHEGIIVIMEFRSTISVANNRNWSHEILIFPADTTNKALPTLHVDLGMSDPDK